ncbi:unnamed protein product [Calypogeia fissa]
MQDAARNATGQRGRRERRGDGTGPTGRLIRGHGYRIFVAATLARDPSTSTPSIEQFRLPTIAIAIEVQGSVWKVEVARVVGGGGGGEGVGVLTVVVVFAGESERVICRARSSSRRTGSCCSEGGTTTKLWPPAARGGEDSDCDQDLLIRAFSSSVVGYSEDGSCLTTRSDHSQRCSLDGAAACEQQQQSDCITNAGAEFREGQELSEVDEGVDDDTGSEGHHHHPGQELELEQQQLVGEENNDHDIHVTDDTVIDHGHGELRLLGEEEEEEEAELVEEDNEVTNNTTFSRVVVGSCKSDFASRRMPTKSTERPPIRSGSRGGSTQLQSILEEHTLIHRHNFIDSTPLQAVDAVVRTESLVLGPGLRSTVSVRFSTSSSSLEGGAVAESVSAVDPISRVLLGRGSTEPQVLAERRGRSHDFFGERLDVVGSRRDEGPGSGGAAGHGSSVQLGLSSSSSWGRDGGTHSLQQRSAASQEQQQQQQQQALSSFQAGEDTVECITNVGEEDDFGTFDVEEFQTSHHGQTNTDEPITETERLSEFQQGGGEGSQDRQSSPSPTFESPQTQTESATLRTRSSSIRLRSSSVIKELSEGRSPLQQVDAGSGGGGRKIPERLEVGRVGKGQDSKDLRGGGEASIASDDHSRRVRARVDAPGAAAAATASSGRGAANEESTEDASTKVVTVRPSRPSGGKDRHSKVNTAKGPRDRRVRLSVPTAVQFYDVQDRLGYDQPSKAVEWLIKKAKAAIDELGRLPARGSDGPSNCNMSDITHGSPYSTSLGGGGGGPVSGSSSCLPERSFSASLNSPFGDHIGNQMGYFIDSSNQQGVPFGNLNHPGVHARDVVGGMNLSQANLVAGQGQLAGLSFPLGQTDLSRGSPGGCGDGGKVGEFGRVESRYKARERARERVKEKGGTGRECGGKVSGGGDGSSPSSLHSPPHLQQQNPLQSSFPIQNAMQSSVHSLHPGPMQSSLFDTALSGIIQSSQQGTLQNLIMQNPSLQSGLSDQVQGSLQHPFQASLPNTLQQQHTSQSMTSLLNAGMQQQQQQGQPGQHRQRSGFTPGPCSSSFSEATSLSSSDFMSVSSIPISHSLSMSELSSFGITSPTSMEPLFPSGSSAVQIPPGFSPGPPASVFRSRPTSAISQSSSKETQPHLQGLTRSQSQLILPPYGSSGQHGLASPGGGGAGSTSSGTKASSTSLYYPPTTSSRMGSGLQSLSAVPQQLQESTSSFSSIRNVGYDYQRVQMMSPGRASAGGPYQSSSSQLQMPARLQGLDDFDEELKGPSPPSSPHVHP